MEILDISDVVECLNQIFKNNVSDIHHLKSDDVEIECNIYDAYILRCGFYDVSHHTFDATIIKGVRGNSIRRFLRNHISSYGERKFVEYLLKRVKYYCEMRLPNKYLAEYERVYSKVNHQNQTIRTNYKNGRITMDYSKLYKSIKAELDYKVKMRYVNSLELTAGFFIYDSFAFEFGVGEKFQEFGGYMVCGDDGKIHKFLGKSLIPIKNIEDVRYNIKIIDDYCRLRLPDKFLQAYDEEYKDKQKN